MLPGELQPGDTRGANRLRFARRVRIAIRGASLRAGMSEYLVNQIEVTADIEVLTGTEVVGGGGRGRLEQLVLRDVASGR